MAIQKLEMQLQRSAENVKGKVLPYSTPSVGPGADPGVQTVSPHVTLKVIPGGRLLLLSARPAVTFPAEVRHRLLKTTMLGDRCTYS